jgi:hypothetical protein
VKTVEVSGRVISPDSKPTDVLVSLDEDDPDDYMSGQSSSTDAKGEFRFRGVPPGSYIVRALQRASDNVYRSTARQKVQVDSDNIDSLILALGAGGDFTGQVIFEGLRTSNPNYIYLTFSSIDDSSLNFGARVKEDGNFEIKGIDEGEYAIHFHTNQTGWYLKSARSGPDNILAQGLHVEKGSSGTLEIVIGNSGAQLEGTVTLEGKPAVAARVRIAPDPETPYNHLRRNSTTTNQNGHFVILGVAPGKYRVTAKAAADPGAEPAKADPQVVTVSEHEHKSVELKLVPPQSQ